MNRTNAVVIGGGTGAPASIRTLLDMGCGVSSVVATASDGAVVVNGENLNRDELAQAIEDLGYDVIE